MKKKKVFTLSLALVVVLFAFMFLFASTTKTSVKAEAVKYSGDSTLWADSTGATFDAENKVMSATGASFNWKTAKLSDDLNVDFTTTESLTLNPSGDWKWEYLTINTTGETGLDYANGVPQSKSSVTLVWGWTTEFSLVEKDAEGNVVFNKKLALTDSDTTLAITDKNGNTDSAFFSNTALQLFDKAFQVKVNVTKVETGVKFDYELLTQSPWGHNIDWTFSYTSTNKDFAADKYLVYGRGGSGTIDETHKILVDLSIAQTKSKVKYEGEPNAYSGDSTLWSDSTGAEFITGDQMSATGASFNWKTAKLSDDLNVDFTTTESLTLNPSGDWKWEYLTINTTGETGLDYANGVPQSKSSVTLVWGWTTEFSLVEKDAEGNVVFNKKLALTDSDTTLAITDKNGNTDSAFFSNTALQLFDKAFQVKVNVTKVETGVKFDYELLTQSPWGHNIDWTFSYTSTNKDFAADKYLVYGRGGSGTIDETHKILVDLSIAQTKSTVEEVVEDNLTFTVNDKSFTATTGTHLFNELTDKAASYKMLVYTKASGLEVITCNGYGVALVLDKYGRLDRIYDGANAKLFDAENPNGKTGAGFGGGDYATYAYTQLQDGETLIIFPNDGVNAADSSRTFALGLRMNGSIGKFATLGDFKFAEYIEGLISDNAENFVTLSQAKVVGDGVVETAIPATVVTKEFGGNLSAKYLIDFTKYDGNWGALAFVFKGTAEDYKNICWNFDGTNNTLTTSGTTGNWLAFVVTHGTYQILQCVDGEVSNVDGANFGGLNGYSFWYLFNQLTTFTIETTDTANGVDVKMTFFASKHTSNDGNTYTCEFSSNNKALWGSQQLYFAHTTGNGTLNDNNSLNRIAVIDSESSYTKDMYHAGLFKDALAAISYESINEDNYSTVSTAYQKANELYEVLTESQKALVTDEETQKLGKVKSDLDNVDVSVLARLAIEKLPTEAFTRENYLTNKALVEDAQTKFNKLSDEQKAVFTDSEKEALKKAVDDLAEFEDLLSYADPVVALINEITLPITNYGKSLKVISKAKTEYDKLYDEEKALVYNSADLTNALTALSEYEEAHKIEGYNFATTVDNFMELNGFEGFSADNNGLKINTSEKDASVYITKKIENEKEVTFVLDSRLYDNAWGNYYFVFKLDSIRRCHNAGSWVQSGNYAVLLIGGDGFKVIECVNGELPMTTDANGNPIANWTTSLDYPTDEEGSQNDIFYIHKNYTVLKIKTTDLYEGEVYKGFKATFTLTGGESGKTFVREYTSTNTYSEGASYFGLEMFVSNPINNGNGEGMTVRGIYVDGVTEYDGAAVKAQMLKEMHVNEVVNLINQLTADVNKDNYQTVNSNYQAANNAYKALTDEEKAMVTNASTLTEVKAKLDEVQAQMQKQEKADNVDAMLNGLSATITESNYASMKEAYETALAAYNALTDDEKALLTKDATILTTVKTALDAYEATQKTTKDENPTTKEENPTTSPEKPITDNTKPTETKKKGCKSSVFASSSFILLGISLIAIATKRRKETE